MLLTVEGEFRDDICSIGQTAAAHDLCTGLRRHMKRHHHQAGVGHFRCSAAAAGKPRFTLRSSTRSSRWIEGVALIVPDAACGYPGSYKT